MSSYFPIHKIKLRLFDFLFPYYCLSCGIEGGILCGCCEARIKVFPPVCVACGRFSYGGSSDIAGRTCVSCRKKCRIYGFFAPFSYGEPLVKELIHTLKYGRVRVIAQFLGARIAEYILKEHPEALFKNALIVPVPLHPGRERVRGFNQAFLIAEELGKKLGLSVSSLTISRVRKTKPQVELSGYLRNKNMENAFAVRDVGIIRGRTIFLVDDVKTTGATLREAARVLREAGAKRIIAVTAAR